MTTFQGSTSVVVIGLDSTRLGEDLRLLVRWRFFSPGFGTYRSPGIIVVGRVGVELHETPSCYC